MGQGIVCFDTRTHKFDSYLDVGCNVISSLSCDGKDLLYVGTDGNGVHFISTKQGRIVRSFQHEVGKAVVCVPIRFILCWWIKTGLFGWVSIN